MTAGAEAVILLGPNAIRGPGAVDEVIVEAALESIDDRLALLRDRVVPVEEVWRDALSSAVDGARAAVVVIPSWWPPHRSSLVSSVLTEICAEVVVWRRVDLLRTDDTTAVVEIADDLVVVHAWKSLAVIPRGGARDATVAVVDLLTGSSKAVIDAASDVAGARTFREDVTASLRTRGLPVSVADDDAVMQAARARLADTQSKPPRGWATSRLGQPRVAIVAASTLAATALACVSVISGRQGTPAQDSAWVVEGRVAIEVPADWIAQRITTGPGSARLQVVSPSDPQAAIQLTQSTVPMQQSLKAAAEVLGRALDMQPNGVFVALNTATSRAGRPAITYREVRADHHVDWTVILAGGVRIAIGCQSSPDRPWPDSICDRAVRSAWVPT